MADATAEQHPQSTSARVDALKPAPDNLRGKIDGNQVNELAKTIESVGLLQPVLVRPLDPEDASNNGFMYEIVAGHRRVQAARKLGWEIIPVEVRDLSDDQRTEIMLVENMQRVDLTPLEEARGYFRLIEHGMTLKELARRIGRSQKHVSGRLRLIELPQFAQVLLDDGKLDLSDAESVLEAWQSEEVQGYLADLDDEQRSAFEEQAAQLVVDSYNIRQALGQITGHIRATRLEEVIDQIRAKCEEKGVAFVEQERAEYGGWRWPKGMVPVAELGVDEKAHRKEPCFGVGVTIGYDRRAQRVELCTNRKRHTKAGASELKPSDAEAKEAQRKRDRELRAEESARRAEELARQYDAVAGSKVGELHDLVVRHAVRQTISLPDYAIKPLCEAFGVEWEENNSASRARAWMGFLEGASKVQLTRVAAFLAVRNAGYYGPEDPTRFEEARSAVLGEDG